MNQTSDSKVEGVISSYLQDSDLKDSMKYYQTQKLKNIAVSESNYFASQRLGFAGESYNDVITRLLSERTK